MGAAGRHGASLAADLRRIPQVHNPAGQAFDCRCLNYRFAKLSSSPADKLLVEFI